MRTSAAASASSNFPAGNGSRNVSRSTPAAIDSRWRSRPPVAQQDVADHADRMPDSFGVMRLKERSYDWRFINDGSTTVDTGSAIGHR